LKKKSFLKQFKIFPAFLALFLLLIFIIFYFLLKNVHELSFKSFEINEINHYRKDVKNRKISLETSIRSYIASKIKTENTFIKKRVQSFYKVTSSIYFDMKKQGYSNRDIQLVILDVFKNVTNKKRKKYFYILELNGILRIAPDLPDLEGKDIKELKDVEGTYFIREIIKKSLLKGEGWVKFYWQTKEEAEISEKITYFKIFRPYNWIMGATFNRGLFLKQLRKELINNIKLLKTSEFINLMIIDSSTDKIIYNSDKSQSNYIKLTNYQDYIIESFNIKDIHLKFVIFSQKSLFLKVIEDADKIFSNYFKKKLTFFIPLSLMIIFIFIFYVYKLSSLYSNELNELRESSKAFNVNREQFTFKEFSDIAETFSNVLERLKKEKEFSKTVIDKINIGFIALDENFIIRFVNYEGLKILCYKSENLNGKNFTDSIKPFIKENKRKTYVDAKFLKELSGKTSDTVLYFHDIDGNCFPCSLLVNKIRLSSGKINYIMAFKDITLRIEQENRLKRLTDVVEFAPFSIVITNIERKIIYANPFLLKHSGYSQNEIYGKSPKIFQSDYNEKFYPELMEKIMSGNTWEGVFLNKRKNNVQYWEHIYIVPIKGTDNEIINFVAFKEDITERKLMEEKLMEAKAEAQEGLRAKSEFLANMSHEIRTPINGIVGFVDLLLETETDSDKRKYLEIIKDSTDSLLNVINDILDISKLEAKKMEFEILNFKISDVIKECINTFDFQAKKKGIELKCHIDSYIPEFIKGDKLRLLQVLNNLISNAIKFTEKGSIDVTVNLLEKTNDTVTLKFSVKDTGIGIAEEHIKKIFEAFTQAEGSTTRRFGGTGLGLAICKEIISNLNGNLEVISKVGEGTEFFFSLSFPIGDAVSTSFEVEEENFDFTGIKILIAEDDIFNQTFFSELFKRMGINADIVGNGLKVIEKLKDKKYNMIFMDINMPVMDGFTSTELIRKLERGEKVYEIDIKGIEEKLKFKKNVIVALTASIDDNMKKQLKDKGFDDYLTKPFKTEELVEMLKKFTQGVSETVSPEDIINIKELDTLLGNDNELREQLVAVFIENCKNIIIEFEEAIKEDKFEELMDIAHKIKGASGNVKAEGIYKISLKMEEAAKTEDFVTFLRLFNKLKKIVERLHH
jgi:PAS domain S-box-containing protein